MSEEVVVMSNATWSVFAELMISMASEKASPVNYILSLKSIEVIIDESIPEGMTEVWNKKSYYEYLNRSGGKSVDE